MNYFFLSESGFVDEPHNIETQFRKEDPGIRISVDVVMRIIEGRGKIKNIIARDESCKIGQEAIFLF